MKEQNFNIIKIGVGSTFKSLISQSKTVMTLRIETRRKKHRTHNSVYVAIAGKVVNPRSVLLRNFVLNGQESASNPLLHIHANRYRALKKSSNG